MNSTKTKILISSIIAIFLIAAICAILFSKNSIVDLSKIITYDITGTWYSDRESGDILHLDKSGTYTSSNWLISGKYFYDKNNIILTDTFGDSRNLTLIASNGTYTLNYTDTGAHTYYRTEAEAHAARESIRQKAEKEENEQKAYFEEFLPKILTTGEWENRFGETVMFTEDTVIFKDASNTETKYSYKIVSLDVKKGKCFIVIKYENLTYFAGGEETGCLLLSPKENNLYTLKGNGQIVMEFTYAYTKTLDLDTNVPDRSQNLYKKE